jgi:hypothetical protein
LHFLFDNYSIDCDCDDCISVFPKTKTISTYGSEYEFLLEPIIQIQEYNCFKFCSFDCCLNGINKESVALTFEKQNKKVNLIFTTNVPCPSCKNTVNGQFNNFKNNPPWVFIQTNRSEIFIQELPKILEIGVKKYQFLSATILLSNHFRAVFYLNKEYFLVDDLNASKMIKKIPKLKIVSCFYYNID